MYLSSLAMNFALDKSNFNHNYLYIMEPVNNNVIENGTFHRIIYSNSHMTLNSLIFKISLWDVTISHVYNKYRLSINTHHSNNRENLLYIKSLEDAILKQFCATSTPQAIMYDNILKDNTKLYTNKSLETHYDELEVCLKISGIWLNDNKHGLTYKFLC